MPTADLHDLPSALRGLFRSLRVYRKELPFAGYSVVKERRARVCGARQTLVENTGLEPVTSWLQTRRSPS